MHNGIQFSSVQSLSCVPFFCDPMNRSTPGLPVQHQLPEFTQTHGHRVSDAISHLILCRPLLLLPPIPPRVFSNESTLRMRWPKYWSFSLSISPSNEHSGNVSRTHVCVCESVDIYTCIRSVTQSCPTLCNPMNRSTPGLPVQHQLPEFTETHVHQVSDDIQP